MSLTGAVGILGLGVLAQAMFCPSDKDHRIENPDYKYCPYCGKPLVKEGEKRS